jgi:hypothetical protein
MNRIGEFKGLHRDRRVFVLASGPSLAELDLSPLERRIVIGLNRSFLAFEGAHYHCVMDQRLFELFPAQLRGARYLFTVPDRPFGIPIPLLGSQGFSFDLEEGIYSGYTIAHFALQVAVYMGFSEIFFLGLDLCLAGPRTHFFGHDFRSENHETTEFPKMRRCLDHAAEVLRPTGVKVYNCSRTSTLHCFPTVSYEWALSL